MTGDGSLQGAMAPLRREPIPGTVFAESLAPANASVRVLARFDDGSAAITAADYGRGHAILIGSFVGAAFEQDSML